MRWKGREQSDNVDDRRGMSPGKKAAGLGGGLGAIILVLIYALMGGDLKPLLEQNQQRNAAQLGATGTTGKVDPAQAEVREFVGVVLQDTEDVWQKLFEEQLGKRYVEPTLVLFDDEVVMSTGARAQADMGPFYYPPDESVFIDLDFCQELKTRFKAPGDFAVAYVLAHEVGHHVQQQFDYMKNVNQQRARTNKREQNKISVRIELQADYLAGVWAHHAQQMKQILEPGDVNEALRAAGAVGDDRLQRQMQGYVVPDSFTHGSSEQRERWFRRGLMTGDVKGADALFEVPENEL